MMTHWLFQRPVISHGLICLFKLSSTGRENKSAAGLEELDCYAATSGTTSECVGAEMSV